ncbi:MAG: cyclophilin family peptidyl-prolyl cis-trans isomerase [Bacteroidia bacterium]|jgi:cyclophilin family peptidyl-prolyl cis-trans isomerase
MKFKGLIVLTAVVVCLFSCKDEATTPTDNTGTTTNDGKDTLVELTTDYGTMIMYMYKGTPLHRANFHKLVGQGFYNETEFHRIIPNFMIQGGDPLSKDADRSNDGTGGPGYTVPAEINTSKYTHILGAVAAARIGGASNPQKASSGSQFYIVVSEAGTKNLNYEYTVFGRVIQGVTAAETIVTQPRINTQTNRPTERIKMQMKFIIKTPEEIKADYGFDVEK